MWRTVAAPKLKKLYNTNINCKTLVESIAILHLVLLYFLYDAWMHMKQFTHNAMYTEAQNKMSIQYLSVWITVNTLLIVVILHADYIQFRIYKVNAV